MLTLCCVKLGCEVFRCFITSDAVLPIGSMELVYIYIYLPTLMVHQITTAKHFLLTTSHDTDRLF